MLDSVSAEEEPEKHQLYQGLTLLAEGFEYDFNMIKNRLQQLEIEMRKLEGRELDKKRRAGRCIPLSFFAFSEVRTRLTLKRRRVAFIRASAFVFLPARLMRWGRGGRRFRTAEAIYRSCHRTLLF